MLRFVFFFFNDTATTEIYTLSLHDALPIYGRDGALRVLAAEGVDAAERVLAYLRELRGADGEADGYPVRLAPWRDRKSTRLNSSHANISYAVFCLKKKTPNRSSAALPLSCF